MRIVERGKNDLGITISGFDINAPDDVLRVKDFLYRHKIVILKDQKMSEQQFCDFSHLFGKPIPYLQENYHHPEHPLIFVSSNVKSNGQSMGVARTGGYWHSDTAFQAEPVLLTLLYPQIIPKNSRRTTLFIDLQRAYQSMPEEMRRKLDSAEFIHSGKWRYKVRKEDVGLDISEILEMIHAVQPPVTHPAIIEHPVTRQKNIYGTRGFTIGIKGWSTDAANDFLNEVFEFIEQPCFITEFQWQLGNIILWDNRALAHKAGRLTKANDPIAGDVASEEETLVYRITIRDGHPLTASFRREEDLRPA